MYPYLSYVVLPLCVFGMVLGFSIYYNTNFSHSLIDYKLDRWAGMRFSQPRGDYKYPTWICALWWKPTYLCTLSVLRSHWVRRKQLMSTMMEQKEASGLSPTICFRKYCMGFQVIQIKLRSLWCHFMLDELLQMTFILPNQINLVSYAVCNNWHRFPVTGGWNRAWSVLGRFEGKMGHQSPRCCWTSPC